MHHTLMASHRHTPRRHAPQVPRVIPIPADDAHPDCVFIEVSPGIGLPAPTSVTVLCCLMGAFTLCVSRAVGPFLAASAAAAAAWPPAVTIG